MAFNIYSYILHAKRFPFLGTTSRPFLKYCINNFIIPSSFVVTYIICSSIFLRTTELLSYPAIILNMLAFVGGNAGFILLAILYFFPTNKNLFKLTGKSAEEYEEIIKKRAKGLHRMPNIESASTHVRSWKVLTYLAHPFKIILARDSRHYDPATLLQVFYQNHVNASLFELIMVGVFLVIGAFQFVPFFEIPAAASACLVLTVLLMVISITMSWLKGWTLSVLIGIIVVVNLLSGEYLFLNQPNFGYGLNYEKDPIPYSIASINERAPSASEIVEDRKSQIDILNNWLKEKQKGNSQIKPKLILVNTSGGGLRSALWTMKTLQSCEAAVSQNLFKDIRLISGSSGGMIGASYYRELYAKSPENLEGRVGEKYLNDISKDVLNRVLFSFATNDIFIRFRKREVAGHSYTLDRGMTFEDQLNQNTGYVFSKPISYHKEAVKNGEIPMMILAPTIINDGRRLLISSQDLGFLSHDKSLEQLHLGVENIEFRRFFRDYNPDSLLWSSALRMNATFPYILPYASLPTEPMTNVLDAGLRDNYGMKVTAQYILSLKDWIEENTSGVVLIQIRDTEKGKEPKGGKSTIADKITNPIGSFYGNFFQGQSYNMDQVLELTQATLNVPVHSVPFELRFGSEDHIALSWHLTALDKKRVTASMEKPWNQESLRKLKEMLESGANH